MTGVLKSLRDKSRRPHPVNHHTEYLVIDYVHLL